MRFRGYMGSGNKRDFPGEQVVGFSFQSFDFGRIEEGGTGVAVVGVHDAHMVQFVRDGVVQVGVEYVFLRDEGALEVPPAGTVAEGDQRVPMFAGEAVPTTAQHDLPVRRELPVGAGRSGQQARHPVLQPFVPAPSEPLLQRAV